MPCQRTSHRSGEPAHPIRHARRELHLRRGRSLSAKQSRQHSGLRWEHVLAQRQPSGLPRLRNAVGVRVAAARWLAFRNDEHVRAQRGEKLAAERAPVSAWFAVRGWTHDVPASVVKGVAHPARSTRSATAFELAAARHAQLGRCMEGERGAAGCCGLQGLPLVLRVREAAPVPRVAGFTTETGVEIRIAGVADLDGLTALLTEAFKHEPLWRWAFPDEGAVATWWRLCIGSALRYPWVWVAGGLRRRIGVDCTRRRRARRGRGTARRAAAA